LIKQSALGVSFLISFALFGFVPQVSNSVQRSSEPATSEQVGAAFSDLRTCLSEEGSTLDVYYLIDNSRSMDQIGGGTGTDVDGLRFKAVVSSLPPLVELAEQRTRVSVAVGLFSKDGRTIVPWTEIDPKSDAATKEIGTKLAAEAAGGGTNWVAGIKEAKKELAARAETGGTHCQALVWVTDGGIDIVGDPVETAQGVVELCGVQPTDFESPPATAGLMYDLRRAEVVVLGALLEVPEDFGDDRGDGVLEERVSKTSYFKPVVEGQGQVNASYFNENQESIGEFSCGKKVEGAQGAMLKIASAQVLAQEFQRLVTCIAAYCTVLPPTSVKCVGDTCEIPVPKGIAYMQLSVPTDFDTSTVLFPNGGGACLAGGCSTPNEIAETGTIRISVQNVGGLWKVANTGSNLNALLFAGLEIVSDPIEVNPLDPEISTQIRVAQGPDTQFDSANYVTPLTWNAIVKFANGTTDDAEVVKDGNSWLLNWSPTEGVNKGLIPTEATISLSATAGASGPGVPELPLTKIEKKIAITKKNLANYPTLISPAENAPAIFTPIEGLEGEGAATILVQGPKSNDVFVCWSSTAEGFVGFVADPAGRVDGSLAASISVDGQAEVTCPDESNGLVVPQGEEMKITILLTANPQADALVEGVMTFDFYGPKDEKGFAQDIQFEVETTVVKSGVAFWIVLAILTLLGIGIPYIALVIFARREAAFSSKLNGTRWAALPAVIGPEGLLKVEEKDPTLYEFIFINKSGLTRKVETGAEVHEVVPPTWWPFKPGRTVVKAASGTSIFTNHDQVLTACQNVGTSSQVLGGVFYFVADPIDGASTATEVKVDDWGNAIETVTEVGGVQAGAPRNGRVVVLAPGDTNASEAISKSMASVRTWSSWVNVYEALSSGGAVAPSSPKPKSPDKKEKIEEPQVTTPVVGDGWGFGESAQVTSAPTQKKSRFGRKEKKAKNGSTGPQPPSGFDFNNRDW